MKELLWDFDVNGGDIILRTLFIIHFCILLALSSYPQFWEHFQTLTKIERIIHFATLVSFSLCTLCVCVCFLNHWKANYKNHGISILNISLYISEEQGCPFHKHDAMITPKKNNSNFAISCNILCIPITMIVTKMCFIVLFLFQSRCQSSWFAPGYTSLGF